MAYAEGRVVFDAMADIPGLDEPATTRLVSIPATYRSGLNRVEVRRGRYIEPGARNEVLVSEAFATANQLQPGDTFHAVINGRRERLSIVGIAISPEFVNEARGDTFPDNRRFGIAWMEYSALAGTMGAGFLGGLVTGILGGLVARWISRWKVAKGVRGVMPVVVTPLLSTLIVGGLFVIVLGRPIKALMEALTNGLNGLGVGGGLALGLVLGAMMGFDLGGPVNKVAYTFATTGITTAGLATNAPQFKIMAAVMAAGMVAPLAMALATTLRPKLFTEPERENGRAARGSAGALAAPVSATAAILRLPAAG